MSSAKRSMRASLSPPRRLRDFGCGASSVRSVAALLATLNSALTAPAAFVVRFLLPPAEALSAEVLYFALVTSILLTAARVLLFVFRRFFTLARLLLRVDNQPVLFVTRDVCRLFRAGFLLFFRHAHQAFGLIFRRRRWGSDAVGNPADETRNQLTKAS